MAGQLTIGSTSNSCCSSVGSRSRSADHFDGASEAVGLINFDRGTFAGYVFDSDSSISSNDNGDRAAMTGVNTWTAGTTSDHDLFGIMTTRPFGHLM